MKSAIPMLLLMAILLIGCVQVVQDKQDNASKEPAANAETKEPAKQLGASAKVTQPQQPQAAPSAATEELPPALPE